MTQNLANRLARIERRDRLIARFAAIAVIFILATGATAPLPDLRVRSLTIVDDAGRVRLLAGPSLEAGKQANSVLVIKSAMDGAPELFISVAPQSGTLALGMGKTPTVRLNSLIGAGAVVSLEPDATSSPSLNLLGMSIGGAITLRDQETGRERSLTPAN